MITKSYNTRANYERLYGWLLKSNENRMAINVNIKELNDKDLLRLINYFLIFSGCMPMSKSELSQQLH